MKRKGFTLVELLAVIVVLAILVTVATPNVLGILRKQKDNTTDIVVTNLKDAAISYAKEQISLSKLHLGSCNFDINATNVDNNLNYQMVSKDKINSNLGKGNKCVAALKISALEEIGIFDDKQGSCDKAKYVYTYKYNNGNYDEIKAYVPDDACEVK